MKTIKQLLITVAVLLCSVTANAYDFEVDGIYYNILSASDLTVCVTRGDNKYTGEVIIPSTVTYKSRTLTVKAIGGYAFENCSIESISIPESVMTVYNYAFKGCLLSNLRIEDGTRTLTLGFNYYDTHSMGEGLFYDCPLETLYLGRNLSYDTDYDKGYSPFYKKTTLTSVTIGNNVTNIGNKAFYGCTGLKEVHISDLAAWCNIDFESNPLSYAKNLYLNGKLVQDLVIPNSVEYIKDKAFENCNALTSVTIPNSVAGIGYNTFSGCTGLKRIEINCATINSTFAGFSCIKEVVIGNSVTKIGSYAFMGCTGLTSITIPNSVTSIETQAFDGCTGLKSVTIGNGVTKIGSYAFSDCTGLTDVEIPNSVTSIEKRTFYNCFRLTNLTIGNSVKSIGERALYNCDKLRSIYFLGETPPTVEGYYNFIESQYIDMTLYVPLGSLSAYQTADVWKNFWDIQEFDVTGIDDVNTNDIAIAVTANGIALSDADGKVVAIYSANGALVEKIETYTGEEIVLDKGVYVVCVGNKTIKVRL